MGLFSQAPARPVTLPAGEIARRFRFIRIRQVSIMLLGYALFYVCRLAFSATKKTMIEQGAYTAREIG
jgi:sugar phosphate permease